MWGSLGGREIFFRRSVMMMEMANRPTGIEDHLDSVMYFLMPRSVTSEILRDGKPFKPSCLSEWGKSYNLQLRLLSEDCLDLDYHLDCARMFCSLDWNGWAFFSSTSLSPFHFCLFCREQRWQVVYNRTPTLGSDQG